MQHSLLVCSMCMTCRKIPRAEMVEHEAFLEKMRAGKNPSLKLLVCGSYRREKPESGDIDALITEESYTSLNPMAGRQLLPDFVKSLHAAGYLVGDLASGQKKYMGVCKLPGNPTHRRIDLRCLPSDQFHFGTLYFTGSRESNVRLRKEALRRGLKLSEYGLTRIGSGEGVLDQVTSESDIFQALGFNYIEPRER